ncbi:MAG: hypothetical protein KIT09_18005 [Bryobacteraceae bacterium]|nr:hypothetical protein [Bryobacteraceae bacterium]
MKQTKGGRCIVAAAIMMCGISVLAGDNSPGTAPDEFTIVRAEKSADTANVALERLVVEARRADGSRITADASDAGDSRHYGVRQVTLVPQRKKVTVDDALQATTTWYAPPAPAIQPADPDPQCGFARLAASVKPVLRGEETILGYRTVVIQTEEGPYLNKVWQAPDLRCATLKMTEERRDADTGQITGRFELYAVSVRIGAPDPKLFEIPDSYVEKSPSEMNRANAAKLGRTLTAKRLEALGREDRRYFDNHRQFAGR